MNDWAITLAVFLPALGAIVVALMPRDRDRAIRGLGILFTAIPLLIGIGILFGFQYGAPGAFGGPAAAREVFN